MKSAGSRSSRVMTAIAMCLTGLGTTVVTAPAADAVANRRICQYSYVRTWYGSSGVAVSHFQWGMNYKKDGGCPSNHNSYSLNNAAFDYSVGKVTCEEFGKTVKVNYDPCTQMAVDSLYYVEWPVSGAKTSFSNHGHY
jgi:hypothetical protein